MITNSGLWRIENETRYNTEDLVSIFNAYEDALMSRLARDGVTGLRSVAASTGVVRFRDYAPVARTAKVARTGAGGQISVLTERVLVRRPPWGCQNERVAGLIKPSLLHSSPLEALANSGEDGNTGPKGFSLAIIREVIRDCYSGSMDWLEMERIPEIAVRIMPNRASKPSGAPVKAVVIKQVRESLVPATNLVGSMQWDLTTLNTHLETARRKAAEIGLELTTSADMVERVREQVVALYQSLRSDFNAVQHAGE